MVLFAGGMRTAHLIAKYVGQLVFIIKINFLQEKAA
jgi:hypothetical protein